MIGTDEFRNEKAFVDAFAKMFLESMNLGLIVYSWLQAEYGFDFEKIYRIFYWNLIEKGNRCENDSIWRQGNCGSSCVIVEKL